MRKILVSVALLVPAAFTLAQATQPATKPAEDPNKVIIEVGDQKVTVKEFNDLVDSLPPQVQTAARGPARRMVADKLVEVKLLAAEAQKEGLQNDPKIQAQLELQRQQVLAQAMAEKAQKSTDDAALKQQYEQKKGDFETVKARHILIHTKGAPGQLTPGKTELTDEQAKAKAEDLRKQILDKKLDFAAAAKANSDDPGSAQAGGELPPFTKGQMVPDFEKAAFSLKPGDISEPIKTPFGYHLIQVEERKTPTFDEVKEELQGQQGPQKVEEFVKKLKEQNPVKIDESFFGPPATHPTHPAMPPMPQ